MPISKKEFDNKVDQSLDRILKVLVSKPDKAYTIKEISKIVKIDSIACFSAMLYWMERGVVVSKLIGKKYYFAIRHG
ncbi:MAG: hypothetical protein NTV30_02250 [Chloroflexi bacterium]|nr:hypothetical protein [Chloroflexota bacterium]